jgi:hypothetical protein
MRIDPKYFNVFLVIVAVIAASLIAYFTMSNRTAEKAAFKDRMFAQDSLKTVWWQKVQSPDSLRITDFQGQFVVVDLWSNWSDASLESHQSLAEIHRQYPDTLTVLAAAVGMQEKEVLDYINKNRFPFHFVAGSKHFSDFYVPGLPAQMIYNPKGNLEQIFLGYSGESQYDSLKTLIHGRR